VPSVSASACKKGNCADGAFDSSKSSSFHKVAPGFNVSYGDGTVDTGDYFTDVVNLGSIRIQNMTMGLADVATNGPNDPTLVQGLLGVGNAILESEFSILNETVPTIYDQLVSEGYINRAAFSLYLDDLDANTGSILFGAIDTTKFTGDLVSLPIQQIEGQYLRYTVTITSISIQDDSGTRPLTDPNFEVLALLDSGTSNQQLPDNVMTELVQGLGALEDSGEALVPCSYQNANASLVYQFGGANGPKISVPFSELVQSLQGATFSNGEPECEFLVMGGATVDGIIEEVILGDSFLRSAYVVYDIANNEIAIAQAALNATSTSNILVIPSGTGLPGVSSTATLMLPTAAASAAATSIPGGPSSPAAASTGNPGTPTFNLGSVAASNTAAATSTGSASNVRIPSVAFGLGTWVIVLGVSSGSLAAAFML